MDEIKSKLPESHPHLCGEYITLLAQVLTGSEPPPLVRGILKNTESFYIGNRATPTYAGNTKERITANEL